MKFNQAQRDEAYIKLSAIYEPQYQREAAMELTSKINQALTWLCMSDKLIVNSILIGMMQAVVNEVVTEWKEHFSKALSAGFINTIAVEVRWIQNPGMEADRISLEPNEAWNLMHAGAAPVRLFNPTQEQLELRMREELSNRRRVNQLFKQATGKDIPLGVFSINPAELVKFTSLVIEECHGLGVLNYLNVKEQLKHFGI